jgi:hypothetical protein
MHYELTDHFQVGADLSRTWTFFSSAENLRRITPAWMQFTITAGGDAPIALDTVLDYTIRWKGLPMRWRTKIVEWSPQRQFMDLQVRGPYALWLHQHSFAEVAGGVECRDRVIYRMPVPLVGRAVHAAVVRNQLLGIFRHRRKVIGEELGWVRAVQPDVQIRPL